MKNFKRNAVVVIVLLFVGAAVYLNWSYNNKETEVANNLNGDNSVSEQDGTGKADNENENADAGLYYENESSAIISQHDDAKAQLDAIRLSRQQARDEAKSALQAVSSLEGASQEAIDAAAAEVTEMASIAVLEAELETKILTKGCSDCVVCISDSGVSVTVAGVTEGLNASNVAQITDIITTSTEYTAQNITISEIK